MTLYKGLYRIESTRLPGWDYRNVGWYFVTICTRDGYHFFGDVVNGEIQLSALGEVAQRFWLEIPDHIAGVKTDACVVMPNHRHGILVVEPRPVAVVETLHTTSLQQQPPPPDDEFLTESQIQSRAMSALSPKAGSLGAIIRSYKSAVTNWAGLNGFRDFAWQPRYWDHIIRDERSLHEIRQYIHDNPARCELERQNPPALRM